jgi:hypothetical protein
MQSEFRPPFNWRDHLKVHPAAELFPPLLPDELKALRQREGTDLAEHSSHVLKVER